MLYLPPKKKKLAADAMRDMQAMSTMGMGAAAGPQMGPTGQPADMHKIFLGEKENLDLTEHEWGLENVEMRLLVKYGKLPASVLVDYKKAKSLGAASSSSHSASSSSSAQIAAASSSPAIAAGKKKGRRQV